MFRLAKLGVFPSRFIDLKDYVDFCALFIFGTAMRRQWMTKGKKSGSISKDTGHKTRSVVSVNHLQSDKSGLVPQLSCKLTSARIWAAQVMVEHFSDLTYVHLIRSTIQ